MKERRWIGFVLVFVLLFEMVQPREKNLPPQRTEQISVCLGVMYGIVKVEAIDFFVSYYRKIGVERVRAFLHPQLQPQIGEFESIPNFIGTLWDSDFNASVKATYFSNHRRGIKECIQSEIDAGASVILVCDSDEYLYFNPSKYRNFQDFLSKYRNKNVAQVSVGRLYYELDLCPALPHGSLAIWDFPFMSRDIKARKKSFFFTEHFLNTLESGTAHIFNVSGRSSDASGRDAHLKHFRRFGIFDGNCRVSPKNTVVYQEGHDLFDPADKSFYREKATYEKDLTLESWRAFVENGSRPLSLVPNIKIEKERKKKPAVSSPENKEEEGEQVEGDVLLPNNNNNNQGSEQHRVLPNKNKERGHHVFDKINNKGGLLYRQRTIPRNERVQQQQQQQHVPNTIQTRRKTNIFKETVQKMWNIVTLQ